jgi:hypothetical protein
MARRLAYIKDVEDYALYHQPTSTFLDNDRRIAHYHKWKVGTEVRMSTYILYKLICLLSLDATSTEEKNK